MPERKTFKEHTQAQPECKCAMRLGDSGNGAPKPAAGKIVERQIALALAGRIWIVFEQRLGEMQMENVEPVESKKESE